MDVSDDCSNDTPRRWRHRICIIGAVLLTIIVALEMFARFGLGLGDPPLMMRHPDIEYIAQPSREYMRFGNRIKYNQWSMRSEEFAKTKAVGEFRVLVMGDSVVNAGALVDQSQIATERLGVLLAEALGQRVTVGNISAGSWGPPNLYGYAKQFGLFDADVIVVVLSSHDYADAMRFEPLGADAPERRPALALLEGLQRYLLDWRTEDTPPDPVTDEELKANIADCTEALRNLLELAQRSGAMVLMAQHLTAQELEDGPEVGHEVIASVAGDAGVPIVQLGPAFAAAIAAGEAPFRDDIHPSAVGQRVMAETLAEAILTQVNERQAN